MARDLVQFDRSVRRERREVTRARSRVLRSQARAQEVAKEWRTEGLQRVRTSQFYGKQYQVVGWFEGEIFAVPPNTSMPRAAGRGARGEQLDDAKRAKFEDKYHLFSVRTRRYLMRRAWRYFRTLGKEHPERYVPGIAAALKLYDDADLPDGLALLDSWGLMHALFHHSPAVVAQGSGWKVARAHRLADLGPAPIYEELWNEAPRALLDLLKNARSRPVRQWVIFLIRRDHGALLASLTLAELLDLLGHEDEEVADLALEVLRNHPALDTLTVDNWLDLLERANPQALDGICELVLERLKPDHLTLAQLVSLARSRPMPVARLGFLWLREREVESEEEYRALFALADAEAVALRPQLLRWARGELSASPHFKPEWVLELLDSRHADVRAEGWRWLLEEPRARDNVEVWQRLFESPYDDVRLLLIAELEDRVTKRDVTAETGALNADLIRLLWATVLLNVHRGGRSKPLVVGQLVRRLERRPQDARQLLPLLGVALRSVRGPEWRAGLSAVVTLAERSSELRPAVEKAFPELELVS
jgi:hypothetical protein